jgi:mannose-6-phosphate isomerase-like protein (cupin superfamily)
MSDRDEPPILDSIPRGAVYENRVTSERCVVLSDGRAGGPAVVHLVVGADGALAGEHWHPRITERFTMLAGELTARIAGEQRPLSVGETTTIAPGVPHDWWNPGQGPASVIVEIEPAERRFGMMIAMLFGLANAGRTDRRGMPGPLQGALLAREFADVIRFTRPPVPVQTVVFPLLAVIGRAGGLRAIYPPMLTPHGQVEPDPAVLAAAGVR